MYGVSDFTTELEDIHYSPGYVNDLETKIKSLEQENSTLFGYMKECDKLNMELKHVMTLKDTYEEKYNEASIKLICIDDDDNLLFSETEQLKSLNEKIALLLHANKDLRKEIESSQENLEKIGKERDRYKTDLMDIQAKFNNLRQSIQTSEKATLTDQELLMITKHKSVSICEDPVKTQAPKHIKLKKSLDQLILEESAFSKFMNRKTLNTETDSPDKPEDHERQDSQDLFSKTCNSKIFVPDIKQETVLWPTYATSNSPFARNMNSPKLKPKLVLSRQSPKAKQQKKAKSAYVPSFMRKTSKVVKK